MSVRGWLGGMALGVGMAAWAAPGEATLVPLSLPFHVISVDAGVTSIAVGDRFQIDLTVDDSVLDDAPSVGAGHFAGLLTSFVMTAHPANTGSWTPSGVFDLGAASNFVTNAFGDGFTFQVRGTGFPDGGDPSLPFFDIDLDFEWPGDITDSGLADTFAQQFGGVFDPALADLGSGRIRFRAEFDFPAANAPAPGAALLLLASLAGAACRIARERRSA